MTTNATSTAQSTIQRRVHAAAARLYDAECALHAAHQSHVEAWVDSAGRKLHDAVAEYLAAVAASPSARPAGSDSAAGRGELTGTPSS